MIISVSYRCRARRRPRASSVAPPRSCSGGVYAGVPTASPGRVSRVLTLSACAMPKSTTFTDPVTVISTFSGLRSRCTTPASCAAQSARAMSAAIGSARLDSSGPRSISLRQRMPFDELGRDEQVPVDLFERVDGGHRRMRDRRRRPRLAAQTFAQRGVFAVHGWQGFERHAPAGAARRARSRRCPCRRGRSRIRSHAGRGGRRRNGWSIPATSAGCMVAGFSRNAPAVSCA